VACQLDEVYYEPNRLFKALQKLGRILLVLDGADVLLPSAAVVASAQAAAAAGGMSGLGEPSPRKQHGGPHRGVSSEDERGEGAEGFSPSASAAASSTSAPVPMPLHQQHDLRTFVSSLLRHCPQVKLLVTAVSGLEGIADVAEVQVPVIALAPRDAAQLFHDLRPRDIALKEFGCTEAASAPIKLSEHSALRMLAGYPRRIFNAAPLLRDTSMDGLTPLIEKQIAREAAALAEEALLCYPPVGGAGATRGPNSRTQTPEPTNFGSGSSNSSSSSVGPQTPNHSGLSVPVTSPMDQAQQVFDHNALLWFGGFGSNRSMALLAARASPLSPAEEREWTAVSSLGADWWRAHFGRAEVVPWGDVSERAINASLAQITGSSARGLEALDFATLRGALEKLGSPPGYMHVQAMGAFWHEWYTLCCTIKRVLPLWSQNHPARVIYGWCSRAACSSLLVDPISGQLRPPGTFAVRLSETQVGHIAVGFVDEVGRVVHTLVLVRPAENDFVLRLTDGDRAYPDLVELFKQCRPFQTLAPSGMDKSLVLSAMGEPAPAAAAAAGEGAHMQQHPPHLQHVSTPSSGFGSGQFSSFPNNALGGGVGLFSPPAPGTHGVGLSQPSLLGSQSHGVGAASSPMQQQQHRLPHPQSFPSLASMGQALPSPSPHPQHLPPAAASNPNAEGQPPAAFSPAQAPVVAPRGPSPAGVQQEGVQPAPPPGGAA
jgi:hypothetical protein